MQILRRRKRQPLLRVCFALYSFYYCCSRPVNVICTGTDSHLLAFLRVQSPRQRRPSGPRGSVRYYWFSDGHSLDYRKGGSGRAGRRRRRLQYDTGQVAFLSHDSQGRRRGLGLSPLTLRAAADVPSSGDTGLALATRNDGQYQLMLVDDEEALRDAVSGYLRERGYSVSSCASAQEGLMSLKEAISGNSGYLWPDLIISDVNMPGMDGYQFLRALRLAGGRVGRIPVVFLTARGMTSDRIEGYRAGVNAYLSKPFDPEELVSIVDNVLLNTMKAAEVMNPVRSDDAQLAPMGMGDRNRNETGDDAEDSRRGDVETITGVVNLGESDDVLGDVRRELGDIKALLLAERAQRRQQAARNDPSDDGTHRGVEASTRAPKLLTSSKNRSSEQPSNQQDPSSDYQDWAGWNGHSSPQPQGESEWDNGIDWGGDELARRPVSLTRRELEVMDLVSQGYTNREIAEAIDVGIRSIEKHVSNMLAKTGTTNRTELVRYILNSKMAER